MQKNLIAALILTTGLISNSHAACDLTPYNAPEDLQVPCSSDTTSAAPTDADNQRVVATEKKSNPSTPTTSATDASRPDKSPQPTSQTNAQ
jgi:hypothetical protein